MSELIKSNVNLDPSFVGYRVNGYDVEAFVKKCLEDAGVDGILTPKLIVSREGNNAQINVGFYVFINADSKDVYTANNKIPAHIRRMMNATTVNFNPSERLKKAITPFVPYGEHGPITRISVQDRGSKTFLYIKCNIFKILAAMFDAPRKKYNIAITEAMNLKKNQCALTVVKAFKFAEETSNSEDDILRHIAMNLEH